MAKRSVARKIEKTDAEWAQELTPEQFHVKREMGTEQRLHRRV